VRWKDENEDVIKVANGKVKRSKPAFMRDRLKAAPAATAADDVWIYLECDPDSRVDLHTYREIPILSPFERFHVNNHLEELHEMVKVDLPHTLREIEFVKYFNQCRQILYRACQSIWHGKKSYSLYTLRKQYSSNMKAMVGSDATAELMGHSSKDSPSAASYGKSNQAHKQFKVAKEVRAEQNKNTEKSQFKKSWAKQYQAE